MDYKEYWNNRYKSGGNSGYGSYGEQLEKKINWLSGLIGVKSIAEFGCGDFNFGKTLLERYPKADYVGYDISQDVIDKNIAKYSAPNVKFTTNLSELPRADLVLCVDVFFHILDEDDYWNTWTEILSRWTKYLCVTTYEYDQDNGNHVKMRKFNYKEYELPIPKIREVVEEDGQLYFYLFQRKLWEI